MSAQPQEGLLKVKLFEPSGLIIILVIALVIFGPTQLPKLTKMLGQSARSLRDGLEGADDEPAPKKEDAE
jgi:sec-independent protein translocase protein TatA